MWMRIIARRKLRARKSSKSSTKPATAKGNTESWTSTDTTGSSPNTPKMSAPTNGEPPSPDTDAQPCDATAGYVLYPFFIFFSSYLPHRRFQRNRLKISRHNHSCFWRCRSHLFQEGLQRVDRSLLGRLVRRRKIVPMRWQHERRVLQRAHQAPAVIVTFLVRAGCSNQHYVWPQSFYLSFDVVHPAKRQNLVASQTHQVCKRPSLRMHLLQRQWRLHSRWSCLRAEVVLVIQRTVQTGNHSDGKNSKI